MTPVQCSALKTSRKQNRHENLGVTEVSVREYYDKCVRVCLCTGWTGMMECLHDYISLLFVYLERHSCATRVCVCVCVWHAARTGVIRAWHTDEFPACADQITQPAPSLSLCLSFSQSRPSFTLLPSLQVNNSAIPQSDVSWPAAANSVWIPDDLRALARL